MENKSMAVHSSDFKYHLKVNFIKCGLISSLIPVWSTIVLKFKHKSSSTLKTFYALF
jgi:hypothetical protein